MYEVFINERPIILTNTLVKETDFKQYLLEDARVEYIIKQLSKGKIKAAHLYHPDEQQLLKRFKNKIPIVVAAGGLVTNPEGQVLFIKRNGKWDLPKGKLDKGETIEEAALREVEEETGVKKLKLGEFIGRTYQIFKRNGDYKLKETYWYKMTTNYKGKLVAQCDEGIEEVVWKTQDQIPVALKYSYANIRRLFQ